ncbi:MAG TPA: DNA topoisomerase VI subunit B [Methylomirabilota bacterium]|nr:DNA topoisomerase VI subunit B [Methylomirabilota bacterium]
MSLQEVFQEISAADFFYRNRDIAGFTNPTRAIYSSIRELVENSLDACETRQIPPEIYLRVSHESGPTDGPGVYRIHIEDNGIGIPNDIIPSAFGQVLFGSKYKLRQTRGTFGLGGKMAILYGQITTHGKAIIMSSTGHNKIHQFEISIDIQKNKPIILGHKTLPNDDRWHGTAIDFATEADYTRAMPKILDYLMQTAIVAPYATVTYVDPRGRLYRFDRATMQMPKPPQETLPHPYGVDVETMRRLLEITKDRTMVAFLRSHFHRVGKTIATSFLSQVNISTKKNPKKLSREEIVQLVNGMKNYKFLAPDASCLSPLGEELLEAGIRKELSPEFVAVYQRKPSAYAGFPFIVEVGIAYGGKIETGSGIRLYRFANKIPLLFDEASDVSWKVVNTEVDWRHYKAAADMPIAVFVHICSTKVPYKTVGKEFIADRPDVEREILNAVREVARRLSLFLSKKINLAHDKRRLDVFQKYLPKIAIFSSKLAKKAKPPDVSQMLKSVLTHEEEIEDEDSE